MPKLVTLRIILEDSDVADFVSDATKCFKPTGLDMAVNIDPLPEILEAAIADKTYEEGDLKRPLHVMIHSDGPCYIKAHDISRTTEHTEDAAEFFAWELPDGLKPYHYLDYVN